MNELIERLAHNRQIEAEYKAEIAETEEELRNTIIGLRLERRRVFLKAAQRNVADAETDVRLAAVAAFTDTGDKKPHPAVQIKAYTTLTYDAGAALDYARQHIPNAVRLDKRAFEKAAKVLALDFVVSDSEARATIARDLSEWVKADEA